MTHKRLYTRPDGTTLTIKACSSCPLRDECEERGIPYRLRGRIPLINKACKLPHYERDKVRRKIVVHAVVAREKRGRYKGSGATKCSWCGQPYNAETQTLIIVGNKVLKSYGHEECMREDIRTEGHK